MSRCPFAVEVVSGGYLRRRELVSPGSCTHPRSRAAMSVRRDGDPIAAGTGFGNYIFSRPLVRSLILFQGFPTFSGFYKSFIFCEIYQHLRSLIFAFYFNLLFLFFIIVIIAITVIFIFICIIRSYITLHQLTIQHYSTIEK
jgi:hypothetical protein